jgi:hypothetical protein
MHLLSMKRRILRAFVVAASAFLLTSCAGPQLREITVSQPAGSSGVPSAAAAAPQPAVTGHTVWVSPPTGSLLGGGFVRVTDTEISGLDETALKARIEAINAAAGSPVERPYVARAVAQQTGVSERDLAAQQITMRLRYGELLAINCIARQGGRAPREIAALKAKGMTWSELATANHINIAMVVQSAHNVSQFAEQAYLSSTKRKSGLRMMHDDLGVHDVPLPDETMLTNH